jgi:uncharacterized protein (TIGR02453 family)
MISTATIRYLKDLGRNNSREWFRENRERYDEARRNVLDTALYLLSGIEKFDRSVEGLDPEECLFRIHRDTRFSRDKTPYKTNFGAFMKKGGRTVPGAGYYLHIEPGGHFLAGGIYMPPAAALLAIRKAIAADPGPLKRIIKAQDFLREFGSLSGEALKTAPRGFPKDHPEIELLKYKHYMVIQYLSDDQVLDPGYPRACLRTFRAMARLNGYINSLL